MGEYLEPRAVAGCQDLSIENVPAARTAKAALIKLVQNGRYSNDGEAFWDDLSLSATARQTHPDIVETRPRPVGTNYVVNGDFASSLQRWRHGSAAIWVSGEPDLAGGAAKISSEAGARTPGVIVVEQCVDLGGEPWFELGATFKRDAASPARGGGRLRMTWYGDRGCRGRYRTTESAEPRDVEGLQKLRIPRLARPQGARSADVTIIQSPRSDGRFSAYWDDVYLTVVDGSAPITPRSGDGPLAPRSGACPDLR